MANIHEFECRDLMLQKVVVYSDRAEVSRVIKVDLHKGINEVHVKVGMSERRGNGNLIAEYHAENDKRLLPSVRTRSARYNSRSDDGEQACLQYGCRPSKSTQKGVIMIYVKLNAI